MDKPVFSDLKTIYLIAAAGSFGTIGREDGQIPWHYPDDLKQFKAKTTGHVVVMGRKTFDSIGRPLPGRITVVQSRQQTTTYDGQAFITWPAMTCAEILAFAEKKGQQLWIAGGSQIYAHWLDWAQDRDDVAVECHLTLVPYHGRGEVKMPRLWR